MIREAAVEDADRIAEIEVFSSRFAYRNILPEEMMGQDLTVENRAPVCRRWIAEKRFGIYVYEDADGILRGMMGIGKCGDEDRPEAFELHFIYVDPAYLRQGAGSEMLRFFEEKAREAGCAARVVWVLEENGIGRSFYEKHGYRPDGKEKIFRRWNKKEIRYVKS